MDLKEQDVDVFFDYLPHIDGISVRIYNGLYRLSKNYVQLDYSDKFKDGGYSYVSFEKIVEILEGMK